MSLREFHLQQSEWENSFICNQCDKKCQYCEKESVQSWDYQSFDLCLGCFQKAFPSESHPHPRESFFIERIAKSIDDEESFLIEANEPGQVCCILCKGKDEEILAFQGKKGAFYIHRQCAEFSPEVFLFNSQWFNVGKAVERGKRLKCAKCKGFGATLGCFDLNCKRSFHIPCCGFKETILKQSGIFWCSVHNEMIQDPGKFKTFIHCNVCNVDCTDKLEDTLSCSICQDYYESFDICSDCFAKGNNLCHPKEHFKNVQLSEKLQINQIIPQKRSLNKRMQIQPSMTGPREEELYSLNVECTFFDIPGKTPRWATHFAMDFPGTWIPQLVRWAMRKYSTPNSLVVSNFLGRGTDAIEAVLLKRKFIGFDVNINSVLKAQHNIEEITQSLNEAICEHGDARNLRAFVEDSSVDLVLSHPPYFSCISYSSDKKCDISNSKNFTQFLQSMKLIAQETWRILNEKDSGRCVMLIGDNREERFIIPVAFSVLQLYVDQGFEIEEIVIKRQRCCSATSNGAGLSSLYDFLYMMHELFVVFRKVPPALLLQNNNEPHPLPLPYVEQVMNSFEKGSSGSIWVFEGQDWRKRAMKSVVQRYAIQGTWYRIYASDCEQYLEVPEPAPKVIPVHNNNSYEQTRKEAIKRNIHQLTCIIQKENPISLPFKAISLFVVQISSHWNSKGCQQLKQCLEEAKHKLPINGYFIINCWDAREAEGKLVPTALLIWSFMHKEESHSQQGFRFRFKDLLVTVPKGFEKRPVQGMKFHDLEDVQTLDERPVCLPIVHEYWLIYQIKIANN